MWTQSESDLICLRLEINTYFIEHFAITCLYQEFEIGKQKFAYKKAVI